jgi:hypothetical protein
LIERITTRFGCIGKTRFRDFDINLGCWRCGLLWQAEAGLAQVELVQAANRGFQPEGGFSLYLLGSSSRRPRDAPRPMLGLPSEKKLHFQGLRPVRWIVPKSDR